MTTGGGVTTPLLELLFDALDAWLPEPCLPDLLGFVRGPLFLRPPATTFISSIVNIRMLVSFKKTKQFQIKRLT